MKTTNPVIQKSNTKIEAALEILRSTPRGEQAIKELGAFLNPNQQGLDLLGARAVVSLVEEFMINHRRDFLPR